MALPRKDNAGYDEDCPRCMRLFAEQLNALASIREVERALTNERHRHSDALKPKKENAE